jgi:hypothetical protein
MNKAIEICKIEKNVSRKYLYSQLENIFPFCLIYQYKT